jgi:hypothetical protein
MLCHAIHFSLQLLRTDWPLPVILQHLGFAQIVMDFPFNLRLRHHRIERWLGIRALLGPDPVTPINVLNRSLVSYALGECESGSCRRGNFRRRFRTQESQQRPGQY